MLKECTLLHLMSLEKPLRKPTLPGARAADAPIVELLQSEGYVGDEVLSSVSLFMNSQMIMSRDFVFYQAPNGIEVGEVWSHFSVDGK